MDDLKLYGTNKDQLHSLVQVVRVFSQDTRMSYLALGEFENLGKMNDLNLICNCDLQWLQLFSCFSRLFQSKSVKIG